MGDPAQNHLIGSPGRGKARRVGIAIGPPSMEFDLVLGDAHPRVSRGEAALVNCRDPYFVAALAWSVIQSAIMVSALGFIVSSISAYSEGVAVLHCWKRWLRPGSSFTVTRLLPALERRLDLGEVLPGRDLTVLLADERQDRAVDFGQGGPRVVGEEIAEPG